jgi:hypothetical protein
MCWGESLHCNSSMSLCILLGVALCSFIKFSSLNVQIVGHDVV